MLLINNNNSIINRIDRKLSKSSLKINISLVLMFFYLIVNNKLEKASIMIY